MPTRAEVEGLRERRRLAFEDAQRNHAVTAELRRDVLRALDDAQARHRGEARVPPEPPYTGDQRPAYVFWDERRH